MSRETEIIKELKEDYNKCNELFDIAFKLDMNENTRTVFTQKTASYMSDVMQTISFLIYEFNDKFVSVGCLEQFKWERDIALQQLEELGLGLGQIIDGKYLSKEEYEKLLEYKYMYEDLCK